MKKAVSICVLMILLVMMPVFAEKSFDELSQEYEGLILHIEDCNEIISACEDYLTIKAETALDTPELKRARANLSILGVLPISSKDYKKAEISYVEDAMDLAQDQLEYYQAAAEENLRQQSVYYIASIQETQTQNAIQSALANGYPVCPSGSTSKYISEARTVLDEAIFTGSEDEKRELMGTVYLLTGALTEHPVFGRVLDMDGKTLVIDHMETFDEATADYTLPATGETVNFILLYTGQSGETYALFYLGASDAAVDFWRDQALK